MATIAALVLVLFFFAAPAIAASFGESAISPLGYNFTMAPFVYANSSSEFYLAGSVSIRVKALHNTSVVYLRGNTNFDIASVSVTDEAGQPLEVTDGDTVADKQWLAVRVGRQLEAGQEYDVSVHRFSAPLPGIDRCDSDSDMLSAYLVGTRVKDAVPLLVSDGPWANLSVSVVRRHDFQAVSNGASVDNSTEPAPEHWWPNVTGSVDLSGWRWVRETFETTPRLSPKSLAFVVTRIPFFEASDADGWPHRFWACDNDRDLVRGKVNESLAAFEYFKERFGADNPMSKMDHFTLRGSSKLAIGTVGLQMKTSVKKFASLQSPGLDDFALMLRLESMANVWLSTVETLFSEDRTTIKSLATYEAALVAMRLKPDWSNDIIFDMLRESLPNVGPNFTFHGRKGGTVGQHFGAAVLRQMSRVFGNATSGTLVSTVLSASLRWMQQPGLPLVNCSFDGSTLLLQQSTFGDSLGHLRPIPVVIATSDNAASDDAWQQAERLTAKSATFNISDDGRQPRWYALNPFGVGVYRVNYDAANWLAIARQLRQDPGVFDPLQRAVFIDDSFALAAAGVVNETVPLSIVGYVAEETEYPPLKMLLMNLQLHLKSPDSPPGLRRLACDVCRDRDGATAFYDATDRSRTQLEVGFLLNSFKERCHPSCPLTTAAAGQRN